MSIPITCPGCKSAFDVPDNLAGKTIRCTSCKAQMAVPDEAAVEVAEEVPTAANKKPFGSGTNATAAAAKPTVASKPVQAKPTARPVAKAAKEEEEDEDTKDAKPKPKAPAKPAPGPKKPAITGTTKKRRDDDDDDDDDDTPRKKKQAKGGSGPMIAIIAGATIGLALIAAVGIYFFTKDKGTDTAANTNSTSTTPSTPTANNPMRPGSGAGAPGNPTPAGPGAPGAPGAGGAGGVGAGPVVLEPPGGMGTPSPGGGGMPLPGSGMGTPTMPGGAPATGNGFGGAIGSVTQLGAVGPWANFTGDGFTADFPGTPATQSVTNAGRTGPLTGVITADQTFLVVSEPMPPELAGLGADNRIVIAALANQLSKQHPPFKGKTATDSTVDGHAAKEFDLSTPGRQAVAKFFIVKDRIFSVAAGKSTTGAGMAQADLSRFFNSVRITYKGDLQAGGGVPPMGGPPGIGLPPMGGGTPTIGQPPMGGPTGMGQPPAGSGQPPFGQPGGNPTASTGDGNRKAKIEQFYAAAFDTENNELFTIDERRFDGRFRKGWLRRYSADFKVLGRYHLPQMATRAVIDPKAGLLYAVSVTNPDKSIIDNGGGIGEIAIYDLKQIRDKKTADGKDLKDNAELKPVATIGPRRMINAIELSADGKSLYVLTTTTTAKKTSSLVVIDTETRKSTSTPLNVPVRDMVKAGDGKNLII
ncbi:MAG TPA: hypothetical protein VGE74_09850, partial [Gemmata sp.]